MRALVKVLYLPVDPIAEAFVRPAPLALFGLVAQVGPIGVVERAPGAASLCCLHYSIGAGLGQTPRWHPSRSTTGIRDVVWGFLDGGFRSPAFEAHDGLWYNGAVLRT
jgi:hypothetical protein